MPLYQYAILPLCHFTTMPFYNYAILQLCHFTTMPFYNYTILQLCHFTTMPLYHYTIVKLSHCTTKPMSDAQSANFCLTSIIIAFSWYQLIRISALGVIDSIREREIEENRSNIKLYTKERRNQWLC